MEGKTAYDIKKRNMPPGESAEETGEFFKGYVESLPKQLDNITVGLLELPNTIMMLPDTVPAGIIDAAEYLNQKGIKGTASDIWNTVRNQFQTKVRDFVAADARKIGNMTGNAAIAAADAALATAGVIKLTKSGKIFGSLDTLDDTLHTVKRAENVMDDALDSTKAANKIENAVENVADEASDAKKLKNVEKSCSTSVAKIGNTNGKAQSFTREDIINSLDGVTEKSSEIANAIRNKDVGINVLGDDLFESYLGCTSDTVAMQIGDQIYARSSSSSLLSDLAHEGTHAIDYLNGIDESIISSWTGETTAYSAERLYQIELGIPVQFMNEEDMMVHIWSNYSK